MKKTSLIALALVTGFGLSAALAQVLPVPQVSSIGPSDLFQDVVNGVPQAQSYYAPAALLGNYSATQGGNNPENFIIGGDATTNLFQRATTGSSVTTTITYGGPDRWAYWSGTSTAMTVSQDTTAADLPTNYKAAFKMARTSGQTGVVQVCMMQEVESIYSYALAGQTAEIDFHAATGSNFSAASANMTVVLITGTGQDEGVSKAAFNYNAGGGGSSTWAGQVNTAVTVSLGGVSTIGRYTVAIPVPTGATEVGVALCFTPVGTAGTNDYVAFSGIQLTRNSALTTVAGTAGAALPVNDARAKSFSRRAPAVETLMQQRYYYRITESATAATTRGSCTNLTSSISNCVVPFPVPLRIVPTMAYATGFGIAVAAQTSYTACTANATSTTATSAASTLAVLMSCATGAAGGALGTSTTWGDSGGTGTISASAEF